MGPMYPHFGAHMLWVPTPWCSHAMGPMYPHLGDHMLWVKCTHTLVITCIGSNVPTYAMGTHILVLTCYGYPHLGAHMLWVQYHMLWVPTPWCSHAMGPMYPHLGAHMLWLPTYMERHKASKHSSSVGEIETLRLTR